VIIGYAEVLEEKTAFAPALRESVDQILKAGGQAASLIRQLLAFTGNKFWSPRSSTSCNRGMTRKKCFIALSAKISISSRNWMAQSTK